MFRRGELYGVARFLPPAHSPTYLLPHRYKYPIAIARRIRVVFPASTSLDLGYDISCVFRKTFASAEAVEAEGKNVIVRGGIFD